MTETKKKIIWTLATVAMTGLAAYSIFIHNPEHSSKFSWVGCPFCSLRNASGIVGFATGLCVMGAVYTWQKD